MVVNFSLQMMVIKSKEPGALREHGWPSAESGRHSVSESSETPFAQSKAGENCTGKDHRRHCDLYRSEGMLGNRYVFRLFSGDGGCGARQHSFTLYRYVEQAWDCFGYVNFTL